MYWKWHSFLSLFSLGLTLLSILIVTPKYLFSNDIFTYQYLFELILKIRNAYCSYYSMYGHVEKLAEEIKKGAASVEGVEAQLYQVWEFNDLTSYCEVHVL